MFFPLRRVPVFPDGPDALYRSRYAIAVAAFARTRGNRQHGVRDRQQCIADGSGDTRCGDS
jgi:hypothetical protein